MKFVGWTLMVVSTITWCTGLFVVPFLSLETKTKMAWAGSLYGIGEITFYGAIPFLGKELVFLIRKYFNPLNWFRKRKNKTSETETEDTQS